MNLNVCIKYLDYVTLECEKILSDRIVSESELTNLIIEINLFKKRIIESDLPIVVKKKVLDFKLPYTIEGAERFNNYKLLGYLTLGIISKLIEKRLLEQRNRVVDQIRENSSRLSFDLKSL